MRGWGLGKKYPVIPSSSVSSFSSLCLVTFIGWTQLEAKGKVAWIMQSTGVSLLGNSIGPREPEDGGRGSNEIRQHAV